MPRPCWRRVWAQLPALTAAITIATSTSAAELRVCADPDNLPFSNRRLEGFENKIAALVAAELDASVDYTWQVERRGFLRRTLNAGTCDLVMGMPTGFPSIATTQPYFRSSYAFVALRSRGLDIASFDDVRLRGLKIGLHAIGVERANTPPAHALARRGIVDGLVGFPMWDVGSIEHPPGRIIDAVADGEIDLAIVWGPFAGFFAKPYGDRLLITPVLGDSQAPAQQFAYDISAGVREDDDALRARLDEVLTRLHDDIGAILADYGVPTLGADDRPTSVTGRVAGRIGTSPDKGE